MKFQKLFPAFRTAALTGILGMAAACGSDSLTVPPGNYVGVGAFGDSEGTGHLYLEATVASDGTATGTIKVYIPASPPVSVPSTDDTITLTGSVTATGLDLTDGDLTVTGTIEDDGTITAVLSSADNEDLEGIAGLVLTDGVEVAIACGSYGFGGESGSDEGIGTFIASAEGDLLGVLGSTDFRGIIKGSYTDGEACVADTSCNNEITATLTGTFGDTSVTFETVPAESDLDFFEEDTVESYSWLSLSAAMESSDFDGGFSGNTGACLEMMPSGN